MLGCLGECQQGAGSVGGQWRVSQACHVTVNTKR